MPMNKKDALQLIKNSAAQLLERDGSGKGFVCPFCGSGSGAKGTGLTSKDGIHYRCWACDAIQNNDLIDIIGKRDKVEGYPARLQHVAKLLGISIDEERGNSHYTHTYTHTHTHTHMEKEKEKEKAPEPSPTPQAEPVEADYTAFYLEAAKHLPETNYTRGLSMDTLRRFNVGFCEEWRHPEAPDTVHTSPRLIVPTSKSTYLARDTRLFLPKEYKKYEKMKVGGVHLFNEQALLNTDRGVFIVEGEIDAMSVEEVGGTAVGLGGITQVKMLVNILKEHKPKWIFIALDNDERGVKAAKDLKAYLDVLGIIYYEKDIAAGYKDANEALCKDREAFTRAVRAAMEAPEIDLQKETVGSVVDGFIDRRIARSSAFYPTHFKALDELLDGGLYEGLYVMGAISSLGKTTFALQLADSIAKHGSDVLLFSLEMSRDELIAKSISRLTYQVAMEKGIDKGNAKTTRQLLAGHKYKGYSPVEMALIKDAIAEYKASAGARLYIIEGDRSTGTDLIRERVKKHLTITGRAPVVVVDYIQQLAPRDDRATDKQNTDRAVTDLKRISRDFNIPVVGISSFNRENYWAAVNLTSFKESGAIEYSSDVLMGLQYAGMDKAKLDSKGKPDADTASLKEKVEEARKTGEPVEIQVKILKSRNGRIGDITLKFLPTFSYFEEQKAQPKALNIPYEKK